MKLPVKLFKSVGFTLIELLLVVTIIAIVSGALMPAFSTYIKKQNLRQAQEQILSDLRTIQNKALTGALSDQLVGGEKILYWGVKFTNNSSDFDFFVSATSSCPDVYEEGQYQGSGNVSVETPILSPSGCVFFDMATGGIDSIGFSDNLILGYSAEDSKTINFNSAGLIKIGEEE